MKIVKVTIELVVDDDITEDTVVDFLNKKLYEDPEFFGDFGEENIVDMYEAE